MHTASSSLIPKTEGAGHFDVKSHLVLSMHVPNVIQSLRAAVFADGERCGVMMDDA